MVLVDLTFELLNASLRRASRLAYEDCPRGLPKRMSDLRGGLDSFRSVRWAGTPTNGTYRSLNRPWGATPSTGVKGRRELPLRCGSRSASSRP
jgi:hypothetical protein